jgi:hypothetical protein
VREEAPDEAAAAPQETQAGEPESVQERSADEPSESVASATDAFADPRFLNELLSDVKFAEEPVSEPEAAMPDVSPESPDVSPEPEEIDVADTVSAAEPVLLEPQPPEEDQGHSEQWMVAAEDILESATVSGAEPVASVEPLEQSDPVAAVLSENTIAVPDEPVAAAAVQSEPEPLSPETHVMDDDSISPDTSSDPSSVETPVVTPSIVARPPIWREGAVAESSPRTDRESTVIEPWTSQPAIQPRGVEDAQEAAVRLSSGLQAATVVLQRVMALLDEKMKVEEGLSLDDIGSMRIPGVDGLEDAVNQLLVFGLDLGREIEDCAATQDKFNHVVDRLTEMAAAQDLDEGWNEIIRQRISEALYTVEKVYDKVAAVLPPDKSADENSDDTNAPSAMG